MCSCVRVCRESTSMPRAISERSAVGSSGFTQACEKKEGRLFTGPRLLLRKSLVRAQPGEPTSSHIYSSGAFDTCVALGGTLALATAMGNVAASLVFREALDFDRRGRHRGARWGAGVKVATAKGRFEFRVPTLQPQQHRSLAQWNHLAGQ